MSYVISFMFTEPANQKHAATTEMLRHTRSQVHEQMNKWIHSAPGYIINAVS